MGLGDEATDYYGEVSILVLDLWHAPWSSIVLLNRPNCLRMHDRIIIFTKFDYRSIS